MLTEDFSLDRTAHARRAVALLHDTLRDRMTDISHNDIPQNGPNGNLRKEPIHFPNPYAACNFIVTWNGDDCHELLAAIRVARESQDRFIQDKLIEYILNIPLRNPRPTDIPAFIGRPIWAVDKEGCAIVGMPGAERIMTLDELREQMKRAT